MENTELVITFSSVIRNWQLIHCLEPCGKCLQIASEDSKDLLVNLLLVWLSPLWSSISDVGDDFICRSRPVKFKFGRAWEMTSSVDLVQWNQYFFKTLGFSDRFSYSLSFYFWNPIVCRIQNVWESLKEYVHEMECFLGTCYNIEMRSF